MPILFVEPSGPSFAETARRLSANRKTQVIHCATPMAVVTQLADLPCAIVVVHARTPQDVVAQSQMLKLIQPQIRKQRARVVYNTNITQVKVTSLLSYYGTAEVIADPINARAMEFKLLRHVRSLYQENQAAIEGGAVKEKVRTPANQQRTEVPEAARDQRMRYIDALNLLSDCWIISGSQIKQIGKRWVLKLQGPAPVCGNWIKVKSGGSGPELLWQWKPSLPVPQDPFVKEAGAWFFRGQKPDFQDGLWWFVSSLPQIGFYRDEQCLGSKISLDSETGTLLIAKDSAAAAAMLPAIRDSLIRGGRRKEVATEDVALGAGAQNLQWVKPLTLRSDVWLFSEYMPRRVNLRWIIRMIGPGPSAGRWIEARSKMASTTYDNPIERESVWHWTPAADSPVGPLISDPGAWVFHGRQPRFEGDHWLFVGDRPALLFYGEDQKPSAERFKLLPDGFLRVAKDSEQALGILGELRKTHELAAKGDGEEREAGAYGSLQGEAEAAEDELAYRNGKTPLSGSDREGEEKEFRFPRGEFGEGEWHKANAGQSARVWAVFVPAAWAPASLSKAELEAHSPFWIYKGNKLPRLEIPKIGTNENPGEWIFTTAAPKRNERYKDLPAMVLDFLAGYLREEEQPSARASARSAAQEGADIEEDVFAENGSAPSLASRQRRGAEEASSSSKADSSSESAPQGALASATTGGAEQDAPAAATSGLSEATLPDSAESSASAAPEKSGRAQEAAPDNPSVADVPESEVVLPLIGEIGLLVLAAEVGIKYQLGVDEAARRMIRCISQAVRGAPVEFWTRGASGDWLLRHPSSPGRLSAKEPVDADHRQYVVEVTQAPKRLPSGIWVIPVGDSGCVLLGESAGKVVNEGYAGAIADSVAGIFGALHAA